GRSLAICRSPAAGAGADGHRHLLRHHRAAAGGAARFARADGHRPCRWRGAGSVSDWTAHLVIGPIVVPLVASAAMLLFNERRNWLKRTLGIATTVTLLAMALLLLQSVSAPAADGGPARPLVY